MCKRKNPTDPLVREFLQTYSMNLLPLPRANARPAELYVKTGRRVKATPGWINEVIKPPLKLPKPFPEPLPDLGGVVSNAVSADLGLGLLGNFLTALGIPPGVINKVKLGYHEKQTAAVSFQFSDVSRISIDPFTIGTALIDRQFKKHPFVQKGNQYFVAAAFLRTPSIVIHAQDATSRGIDVGAGVVSAVDANAEASAERTGDGSVVYRGKKPLAIGAELYELHYDADQESFVMGSHRDPVGLMRGRRTELERAFPAEDDETFLFGIDEADDASGAETAV